MWRTWKKTLSNKGATRAYQAIWNKNLTKETSLNLELTIYNGEMWPETKKIKNKICSVKLDYTFLQLEEILARTKGTGQN